MHMCTVNDCDRPIKNKANKLCDPHYKRLWRTGDVQAGTPLLTPRARPIPVRDFPDGTRECHTCSRRLPLSDFHADAKAPGGRRKTCKPCRIEVETARYWEDPESVRVRVKQYRAENIEVLRETERARYERHKPQRIALATEASHRRRASMYGRKHERGITTLALRRIDGDECCFCRITMVFASFPKGQRPDNLATLEHVIPLSKGGAHTWDNVALSCWRDNITKGAATQGWTVRDGHRLSSEQAMSA